MTYNYRTKGVCSKEMHIELNDDHTIRRSSAAATATSRAFRAWSKA